ncbi:hypothetical protein HYU19_01220 [Candidatus Woesearchaeota archaeon]|nr:hypothetical protein [Candidatus Woesearchaeota archaeon]
MIDEQAVREGFRLAKQDIQAGTQRLEDLQHQVISLQNQLHALQEKLGSTPADQPAAMPSSSSMKDMLRDIMADMNSQARARRAAAAIDFNKKDTVKARIIEAMKDTPILLPRLKELIVDEQGHCSKASFYRYMDELKQDGKVIIEEASNGALARLNKIQVVE